MMFLAKLRGSSVAMKPAARPFDAMLSWVGAFAAIGLTESLLNILDSNIVWRGQVSRRRLVGVLAHAPLCFGPADASMPRARGCSPSVPPRALDRRSFCAGCLSRCFSCYSSLLL